MSLELLLWPARLCGAKLMLATLCSKEGGSSTTSAFIGLVIHAAVDGIALGESSSLFPRVLLTSACAVRFSPLSFRLCHGPYHLCHDPHHLCHGPYRLCHNVTIATGATCFSGGTEASLLIFVAIMLHKGTKSSSCSLAPRFTCCLPARSPCCVWAYCLPQPDGW